MIGERQAMKKIIKRIIVAALAVATVGALSACSQWETPFDELDKSGSTVSVRFDVGDGMFAGATTDVFVIDVFDPTRFATNSDGNYEIPLVTPDSALRGDSAFEVSRTGYFLAGWYTEKTPRTDESGRPLDDFGQPTEVSGLPQGYVFSGKWDFEQDKLEVDSNKEYSSENYALTLYAAWIPYYNFEFYSAGSSEPYATVSTKELTVPTWKDGALAMKNFPKIENKTLEGVYLDAELTSLAGSSITGAVDYERGISLTPTVKVYTTWREGNWFKIENVQQFLSRASADGSYELLADLDFTGKTWPRAFSQNDYTGTIIGNGYKMSNITVEQTNTKLFYSGLFASLTDSVKIENVTFENVTFNLRQGSVMTGASFGLFAGKVSSLATFDEVTVSGTFAVYPDVNTFNDSCFYGLVIGSGSIPEGINGEGVTHAVMDDGLNKNTLTVTVDPATGEISITKSEEPTA